MSIRGGSRPVFVGLITAVLALSACNDGDSDGETPATSTSGPTTSIVAEPSTTSAPATTTTVAALTTTTRVATPPQVTGLTAQTGGGSGEVLVNWPPLLASADVAAYRLYKRQSDGTELAPVTVTIADLDTEPDGRLRVIDAFDSGPWRTVDPSGPRCYRVSAVSTGGVEGPQSAEACGAPVGG